MTTWQSHQRAEGQRQPGVGQQPLDLPDGRLDGVVPPHRVPHRQHHLGNIVHNCTVQYSTTLARGYSRARSRQYRDIGKSTSADKRSVLQES